jgi:hypothetical protein
MDLQKVGREVMDWMELVRVGTVGGKFECGNEHTDL